MSSRRATQERKIWLMVDAAITGFTKKFYHDHAKTAKPSAENGFRVRILTDAQHLQLKAGERKIFELMNYSADAYREGEKHYRLPKYEFDGKALNNAIK